MGINFFDHLDEIFTKQVGQRETVYRKLISDMLTKAVNDGEISDTSGLEKNLESVLTLGLRRAKDRALTKVDSIDLADFIDMDASSLNKAIDSLVDDFANKGGKRIAKKLKSAMLVADARGINIQSSDLKAIERDVSRVSGMTTDMIDDINNKLNELNVNKATEGIRKVIQNHTSEAIQDLQEMVDAARKKSEKLFNDTEDHLKRTSDKIREANKDALEAKKNQEKVDKANRDKVADERRQSGAPGYGAPKPKDTKEAMETVNDVKQLTSAIISTFNEYAHIKDRFAYAIDSENNPLQKLLQSFEKGDISLDEALAKVKQLGELNKLIDDTVLPSKAMSGEGLSLFNTALKDVADGSMDAQGAFDKLMDSLRQGSTLIGNEGRATINAKSSLKELNQEYQRLSDVIESTKDSSGLFDKLINAEAQQSLETVSNFRRKLTHHLNEKGEWVPNKAEKTKTERDFSSPEWQQAITNLFNKSEETKQEVDKVSESLDEAAQSGAKAGDKIAEGMKEAKDVVDKTHKVILETEKDLGQSMKKTADSVNEATLSFEQLLQMVAKIRKNQLDHPYGFDVPANAHIFDDSIKKRGRDNAELLIKNMYSDYRSAIRKHELGEITGSELKNVVATIYKKLNGVSSSLDIKNMMESYLPKQASGFIKDYLFARNPEREDVSEYINELSKYGQGKITQRKKSLSLTNKTIDVDGVEEIQRLLNNTNFPFEDVMLRICNILGIELPQNSSKAIESLKEQITYMEFSSNIASKFGESFDKYEQALNKDFTTKNRTEALAQLASMRARVFKDGMYKGFEGMDPETATEDGVRAGFLYLSAYKEAIAKGANEEKIGSILFLDHGSPLPEMSDVETKLDQYKQRLQSIVEATTKPSIVGSTSEGTDDIVGKIKAESDAHAENAENIRKEAEAKKESEQHSPTPDDAAQVKVEADAHAENAENIQKEAEAKKESRAEDEKKSSANDEMARRQQELAALQKTRDEKRTMYEEEAAHLRELQIKSDAIFAQSQDTRKYDHYKESYKNAKLDNFDFIKDQPVSHIDALWQRFVDHGKRYLNTGDDAALGKAAGYYKQYADAVREAGEEVQRAKIGQNDLTDKLVSEAEALEKTKGITFDAKELNAVNIEIGKVRENVEKLEAEYNAAQKELSRGESEMMAAQLSPAVQQQLQLREEADKTTAAVEKQKEAMQTPAESMDKAVESEEELADVEEKVAEKAKEAADAKEKEKAAGDNSKAVEQEKEEEAAIEKKTAARKRSLEVKEQEQKSGDNSKAIEQNNREAESLEKLRAVAERRAQQQREVQNNSDSIQTPMVIKAEDLSPVLMQLANIIGLLERKNNLFIREGSIVAEQAAKEVGALKEVAEVVASIVKNLQEASSKKINISFKGLESLNSLVGKDLTGIVSALESLAKVGEVNMSVKTNGIKGLEALTNLNLDKLQDRLDEAWIHIDDFAKNLSQVKVEDGSLFNSLNNLLKDGEKLKNLATALKASKKQIDNVTEAISKPKEQPQTKVDLSEWKELNKVVKEYYELKNTDSDKLTRSEQGRLTEIEGLWTKVRGEVEKTTAALKEQGQSTKLIEDVTRAYTTGFAEWQNQQMANGLNADRTDLSKLSERFNKRLNDYPSKYVEEAKQQVQQLTAMVDALNAKPIDASKPEDIAQIREEIAVAKELANEIQQGFNSADWRVANQTKVSNLQNEISMYMKNFSALSEETKGKLRALNEELDHVGSNEGLAQAVQKFNKIKIAARDAGEEGTSFFSKMGKQIEHLNAQAFAMYLSWQDIIRYIRQAASAVIELDSALTELRKVSDASTERLQQSFETSAKTAKELGSTVDSVINQTADFSRLGFNIGEAEELARVSTMFQTVGDNMTTDTASQYLISSMQGFQKSANDAMDIIDKYNEVA